MFLTDNCTSNMMLRCGNLESYDHNGIVHIVINNGKRLSEIYIYLLPGAASFPAIVISKFMFPQLKWDYVF